MSSEGSEMVTTADAVAEKWRLTRAWFDQIEVDRFHVMTDVIDSAYAVPVLRQLFVDTRIFALQFSTCAVHQWSDGIPAIEPRMHNLSTDGSLGPGFVVRNPPWGDVIGEADDVDGAITLLVANLPPDVGPAGACRHARHPYKLWLERGQRA